MNTKRQQTKTAAIPARKPITFVAVPLDDPVLLAYAKILHRIALKKHLRQQGELAHAA